MRSLDRHVSMYQLGAYTYVSPKTVPVTAHIQFYDDHFVARNNEGRNKSTKLYKQRPLITYSTDHTEFHVFDGKMERIVDVEEFTTLRKKFLAIRAVKKDPEEMYNEIIKIRADIKQASNNVIDIFNYVSVKQLVLDFWRMNSKGIAEAEDIDWLEAEALIDATHGGLIYHEKYEGKAYEADVNSMYPHYMSSKSFIFPVRRGEMKYLTAEQFKELKYYSYGLYRVKITGESKRFLFSARPWHTHYDLQSAKAQKLNIELIVDDKPNFLSYEGYDKRISGFTAFDKYVKYMYNTVRQNTETKEGDRYAKFCLSQLWGSLSAKNRRKLWVGDEKVVIDETDDIQYVRPISNGTIEVKVLPKESAYMTNFARIAPFLTSYCRWKIAMILEPLDKDIVRIHTDGFITKAPITGLDFGTELGQFKRIKLDNVKVLGLNKIERS